MRRSSYEQLVHKRRRTDRSQPCNGSGAGKAGRNRGMGKHGNHVWERVEERFLGARKSATFPSLASRWLQQASNAI